MSKQNNNITIFDIARVTGFSKSTVSRALRGDASISDVSKKKIRAAADQLHYRPNMLFSILGSGNRKNAKADAAKIGIAYLYHNSNEEKDDFTDLNILRQAAADYSFFVEGFDLAEVRSTSKFTDIIYNRGYAGVIIGRIIPADSIVYELKLDDFSVICLGGTFKGTGYNRVIENFFNSIKLCYDKLREAGYNRLGITAVRHHVPLIDDDYRYSAAMLFSSKLAKKDRIPPFTDFHDDYTSLLNWVRKWNPDAVVAFQASHYWHLIDAGYKIPEDLGYVQLIVTTEITENRKLSGVFSAEYKICIQTLSLMEQMIRNRLCGTVEFPITVEVEPEWNDGTTYKYNLPL